MKNPNVRILLLVLVLVAAVGCAGFFVARTQGGSETAVQAYLRLQVGDEILPLVALGDGEQVVEQEGGVKNVIRTTSTGAVMQSSTCHNQNCVQQGEVTLANRDDRALGNMIICLPNKVIVEVLTPQEAGLE